MRDAEAYRKARLKFFLNLAFKQGRFSPQCEVCLEGEAKEVHHKKGRMGEWLTNQDNFLGVCPQCHRRITENPEWAYKVGYSIKRNQKE